jgi:hypothetical protein
VSVSQIRHVIIGQEGVRGAIDAPPSAHHSWLINCSCGRTIKSDWKSTVQDAVRDANRKFTDHVAGR